MNPTVLTPELVEKLPPAERAIARRILNGGFRADFNGHAWHVTGHGIDVHAVDLRAVNSDDLRPVSSFRR